MSTQERIEVKAGEPGGGRGEPARSRFAVPAGARGTGAGGQGAQGAPGGPGGRAGERLPRPPGTRRPGLAVLAVLLIVLGAAVAGLAALRIDDRQEVLVARTPIAVGQQIAADNLAVAKVASDGIAVIGAGQADQVIGRYAGSQIPAGRLLDPGMLAAASLLSSDKAAVGVPLAPGRYPAGGLSSGDVVQVVRVVEGEGKQIAAEATVSSVKTPGEGVFGSGSDDQTVVTLIVERDEAVPVAAAAAADQISLVLLERGATTKGS